MPPNRTASLQTVAQRLDVQRVNPKEPHDHPVLEVGQAYAYSSRARNSRSKIHRTALRELELERVTVLEARDNCTHDGRRRYLVRLDDGSERQIAAYSIAATWDEYARAPPAPTRSHVTGRAVYPGLAYFNEVDKGGHFAAWEEPELFSTEVRAAFSSLH